MATSSRSAERFKYCICLNDECTLCKEKKVQQIPMRKDLLIMITVVNIDFLFACFL